MYFCLSCITSREEEARIGISNILKDRMGIESLVWFPKKEVCEKRQGKTSVVQRPLFPGYIFIFWDGEDESDFPFYEIRRVPNVIRFLGYDDRSHALKGKDQSFAKWIHMYDGCITQSKVVYREGQKIHICSGPLLGFDGNVIKVDKHHKRITVRFEIGETCSDVSFTVDFLEQNSQSGALSASTF